MGTDKRNRKKENRRQRLDYLAKQQHRRRTRKRITRLVIVIAAIVGVTFIIWVSRGDDAVTSTDTTPSTQTNQVTEGAAITGETPCPAIDGTSERAASFENAPPNCLEDGTLYSAVVTTNKGEFTIALNSETAPLAVNSFVTLARYQYFDNTQCHRAIPEFVVQCGDPTATGSGGPGYSFADELPQEGEYVIGSIAMANSGPDTNGSQFFIITGEQGVTLPPSYTLFGQVTDGLDTTVPALNAAANPDPAANGVPPLETLTIVSVKIIEN
ncbi:MAG: peptidylprolyl isomerase [Ilumatobacteraceae bacterium]|jgi:cyclophilin family peptidyl-prolyl cis-trans isomerase